MKSSCISLLLWTVLLTLSGTAQAPSRRLASGPLLEDDRVRVQRVTVPVGYRATVSVLQNDLVVVQASPGEMDVMIGQNKTTGHVEPGTTWYVPKTVPHQFSNVGDQAYETVIVFLK